MYMCTTVPCLFIVELNSQVAKLGKIDTKSTTPIVNVLSIQCL